MRQERHVCDHVKKSSCLHGIRCLAKTRNLNSRGHSVMKLSVGGTQSLNATCKLLIAEKTFYIFVNEKNFLIHITLPDFSAKIGQVLHQK